MHVLRGVFLNCCFSFVVSVLNNISTLKASHWGRGNMETMSKDPRKKTLRSRWVHNPEAGTMQSPDGFTVMPIMKLQSCLERVTVSFVLLSERHLSSS